MSGIRKIEGPRAGTGAGARKQLQAAGYLEEEYVVRGGGDLFSYDASGSTVLARADVPYVTRVVIRRPNEPGRFCGDAVIEALHPAGDMASAWARTGRAILREGMAWIGVTQDVFGLAATKRSDPERYAELEIPEPGLGFDIVAQMARWLRSDSGPIAGLSHLFMTGASFTGTFQRVFINDGFHARARRPDGGPAVEGYLIQISSGGFMRGGYTPLSKGTAPPPAGDWRRTAQPGEVPVIELLSEGEAETQLASRRPDSDSLSDRYRLYEVPGACHMTSFEAGPMALPIAEQPSDFPMDAFAGGALVNLRRWVKQGEPPPRAPRLVHLSEPSAGPHGMRDEALVLERDTHGNAVGGVRSPYVDVPVASYYPHSTPRDAAAAPNPRGLSVADVADLMGHMKPFPAEKLRELYGTKARYRALFDAGVQRLLDERWVAADDAARMREQAAAIDF